MEKYLVLGSPFKNITSNLRYRGIERTFLPDNLIPPQNNEKIENIIDFFYENIETPGSNNIRNLEKAAELLHLINECQDIQESFELICFGKIEDEFLGQEILGWDITWDDVHSLIAQFLISDFWNTSKRMSHKQFSKIGYYKSMLNSSLLFNTYETCNSFLVDFKEFEDSISWGNVKFYPIRVGLFN